MYKPNFEQTHIQNILILHVNNVSMATVAFKYWYSSHEMLFKINNGSKEMATLVN